MFNILLQHKKLFFSILACMSFMPVNAMTDHPVEAKTATTSAHRSLAYRTITYAKGCTGSYETFKKLWCDEALYKKYHARLVAELSKPGFNVNSAIGDNKQLLVDLLLIKLDAEFDQHAKLIELAVCASYINLVCALIDLGAELNYISELHDGLLHQALEHSSDLIKLAQIITILLTAGINPDHRGHEEKTPLILAVTHSYTHIINLLMDAGAQAHIRDNKAVTKGDSAWHYAGRQDDGFASIATMFEIMEYSGASYDKILNALLCENYENRRTIDLLRERLEKYKPFGDPEDIINKRAACLRKIITRFFER